MILIFILAIILLLLGIYEKRKLVHAKTDCTLRIQVNGIRGKSTLVRMLTDLLTAAGKNVSARVSGEAPQIFDTKNEWQVFRRRGSARIKEISHFLQKGAKNNPEMVICENMALQSEYQRTFSEIFSPQISIYTNFRLDHAEVIGSTTAEVARTLFFSLPEAGEVIIPEAINFKTSQFSKHAEKLAVKQIPQKSRETAHPFDFSFKILHEIGAKLNIEPEIIKQTSKNWRRKLAPENFVQSIRIKDKEIKFVNLFTCNDAESASEMVHFLRRKGQLSGRIGVILACRADRPLRTLTFIDWLLQEKFWNKLIIQGDVPIFAMRKKLEKAEMHGSISFSPNINFRKIMLGAAAENETLIGMGNFLRSGEFFMREVKELNDGN